MSDRQATDQPSEVTRLTGAPAADQSAFQEAPPKLAPARLVFETYDTPPNEFRPLQVPRNQLGGSQRVSGRPPEPTMCPARYACLAPTGQRPSSGHDAKEAFAAATTTTPHRGAPAWHGRQVSAPPVQQGPLAKPVHDSGHAERTRPATSLPPAAAAAAATWSVLTSLSWRSAASRRAGSMVPRRASIMVLGSIAARTRSNPGHGY